MTFERPLPTLRAHLLALILGLAGHPALAQTDPPGRVARLNHTEGTAVTFSPAGDNEWLDAPLNRALIRGDRLWTDKGARAEIQVGSSAVRMEGQTQLEVLRLDDASAQLSVTQGSVYVRVRNLPEGENFEIDTPQLAYRAAYPGDYRIDVDAARGTTRVTIHSGTGAVYGETGQVLPLGGGQQITFRGRSLAQVTAYESPLPDGFDRWAMARNRRDDQSVSARHVPRELVGYQQLDTHGQWTHDLTYGVVWFPQGTPPHWAPYRHGHWEWTSPWGWTWIDDAPWGFATSHYGRWALIGSRWAWVPGRIPLRPVYAPALVAFIGGGGTGWSLPAAAGRDGVAWFPLAPGEAWQPGFRASPMYLSNVNRGTTSPAGRLTYQNRPEALTAISGEDFNRGRPVRGNWLRVAAHALAKARIVPPPPVPERTIATREPPATPRPAPPPQLDVHQVAIAQAPPQPGPAPQKQQGPTGAPPHQPKAVPPQATPSRPAQTTPAAEAGKRQTAARSPGRRHAVAKTDAMPRRAQVARAKPSPRAVSAHGALASKRQAVARSKEKAARDIRAQRQEQSRLAAARAAQTSRRQHEQAQFDAWDRYQRTLRDRRALEQQERARQRPNAPDDRHPPFSEVWHRGTPTLNRAPIS